MNGMTWVIRGLQKRTGRHNPAWRARSRLDSFGVRLRPVPSVLSLALLVVSTSSLSTGCGAGCDRTPGGPPVQWSGGTTDKVHQTYESAPISGPYLDFPGGRTYRFFHGLAGVPQNVIPYFSFDAYPTPPDNPGGLVIGAGNQATIEAVNTTYIDIRNDTCSDVRLRIYADAPLLTSSSDGGP